MPTRVLLLRHAESADPTVFHGAESDIALSPRGRRQAESVAPVLAALGPTCVIASAMRRALDTAAPIARACEANLWGRHSCLPASEADRNVCPTTSQPLSVRVEPLLHERRVGALSGTPTAGTDGVWPETLRRWVAGDTGFAPAGAESFDDIRARVLPVWDRLATTLDGQTFVVVAHGVVIKVLLLSLLREFSVADWHRVGPIRNVAVNELLREPDGWRAVRLNELPPQVVAANEERNPS